MRSNEPVDSIYITDFVSFRKTHTHNIQLVLRFTDVGALAPGKGLVSEWMNDGSCFAAATVDGTHYTEDESMLSLFWLRITFPWPSLHALQYDVIFFKILMPMPPDTRGTIRGGAIVDTNNANRKKKESQRSSKPSGQIDAWVNFSMSWAMCFPYHILAFVEPSLPGNVLCHRLPKAAIALELRLRKPLVNCRIVREGRVL